MPTFPIKIHDLHVMWSTIVDAPIAVFRTKEELKEYIKVRSGQEGLDSFERWEMEYDQGRTNSGRTVEQVISGNRAGSNETELSFEELYALLKQEVIEMEDNEQSIEQPHSVEISINAKGQFSGKVKCYATTPEEAMKRTTALAAELEQIIKTKNGGA